MKVSVDESLCEAHGQCYAVDPELFPLDEDGFSAVGQDRQVPGGDEEQARAGAGACPVMALSVDDD